MRRRATVVAALLVPALAAGGVALARTGPDLAASGPAEVSGTEASATFRIADRTVRQVRYADGGTLRYTFSLTNDGLLPVEVVGLADEQPPSRLFRPTGLTAVDLGPGESGRVTLSLAMGGCETLSARAGAFVTEVVVATDRGDTAVALPEELHTGSPREAFCPNSTATSRPPG